MCLAALAIMPASADLVTYSTTGVFGSTGTNVYAIPADGLTITYGNTVDNTTTVPPQSIASFGTLTVAGPTSGISDTVSDTFTLEIEQTTPTVGGENLTDTFTGDVTINSSGIELQFTGGGPNVPVLGSANFVPAWTFDLGNIQYWVNEYTPLAPSTSNGGVSTINGAISTVPDGGVTLMLLGGALVGLETLRRKLRV